MKLLVVGTFQISNLNSTNFPLDLQHSGNFALSGTVNANELTGNKNTTITNARHHVINSNNTDHSTVVNRNSFNKISTIKKTGNVNKQINSGQINVANGILSGNLPLSPLHNSTALRKNLKDILHSSLYHPREYQITEGETESKTSVHRHLKIK
jgi:hypothetical protein